MKKILYILVLVFGIQTSQAQIQRYKPQSHKDSFLEWLEVGVGYFEGKVSDKQFGNSKYSDIKGIAIDSRIKLKNILFLHGNAEYGLPGYDRGFVSSNFGEDTYIFRSRFHKIQAGFGFYVIGHHKSTFAFAPIGPTLGFLQYSVKFNYFINNTEIKDGTQSGSQIGYGNLSTMRLRFRNFHLYTSLYLFTTLNNSNNDTGYINTFDTDTYNPEFFMYTLQVGLQIRL